MARLTSFKTTCLRPLRPSSLLPPIASRWRPDAGRLARFGIRPVEGAGRDRENMGERLAAVPLASFRITAQRRDSDWSHVSHPTFFSAISRPQCLGLPPDSTAPLFVCNHFQFAASKEKSISGQPRCLGPLPFSTQTRSNNGTRRRSGSARFQQVGSRRTGRIGRRYRACPGGGQEGRAENEGPQEAAAAAGAAHLPRTEP